MNRVVVVGAGVVGAAIAYELSLVPDLQITLLDRQPPAQDSTGAALGVLMGAISQKTRGRAWRLREASLRRYKTLIPELEALMGNLIPVNRDGILLLGFADENWDKWRDLAALRQTQGWRLEIWDEGTLRSRYPQVGQQLGGQAITGAVYSPGDRQIDPVALTQALVSAAQHQGVTVRLDTSVMALTRSPAVAHGPYQLHTTQGDLPADWIILAAGLGSPLLSASLHQSLDIRPVLGQALRLHLPQPLGTAAFRPVLTGQDLHIVPLGERECWVGATVEFPDEAGGVVADAAQLQTVLEGAIALCPLLAGATVLHTWSGQRPRPFNRSAPVIEPLPDHPQVILATGHYRNGVLLAPATALQVRDLVIKAE
ncbi:MAG: FAD-dependent oxidoreductase [Synechococcales bacterium]|nr:FAD-dependent oxidoreductase [Synechococcales bacterium]